MTRSIYIFLLFAPYAICGALIKNPNSSTTVFLYLIAVYNPILTLIRMKYLKMSWKEIFKAIFGFSIKQRFRISIDR